MRDFLIEKVGLEATRTPVVYNWTASPELLAIGERRASAANDRTRVRLLFVGWLDREKGVLDLLHAFRQLSERFDVELTLAGRGNVEAELRQKVAEWALAERVILAGWVDGPTRNRLFQEADIFVLPSWSEGFPNSVVEAMAAGLAVVVSAVGNIPGVLSDRKEVLLVPPRDRQALYLALAALTRDRAQRVELSRSAHSFAIRHFSVDRAVEALQTLIANGLNS